ncbi:MAG: acireductone synthase [Pontibacterium sp.]
MAVKAILTDIEGTTTDINFVHKVLFPYAAEHLPDYVRAHAGSEPVDRLLAQARVEIEQPDADIGQLIEAFLGWIEQDKKVTPLKTLQGLIWAEGYHQGDFTGHLYQDAIEYLNLWYQKGISLYVFSSGSVNAQKLLFAYSDGGDLTGLFKGYFDTTTGHKREVESYRLIAEKTGLAAADIVFLSDITEELDAARQAGMATVLLARDIAPAPCGHQVVSCFSEIRF